VLNWHVRENKQSVLQECDDEGVDYQDLKAWLESAYDDRDVQSPIKRDILLLITNNKTMVLRKD